MGSVPDRMGFRFDFSRGMPISLGAHDLGRLVALTEQLLHAFSDEMESRSLFGVDERQAAYLSNANMFGDAVASAFPSASDDISEAVKCRSLGRWTASVMHLMRVLEVGLEALAQHVGVQASDSWNKTLNEIEKNLREVRKATHGEHGEQWAAEAGTHLRF